MKKKTYVTLNAADPHIVKSLADHLIAAYEEFINEYPGNVDYIDGLMAAHNFHKAIVIHLVAETGWDGWWALAKGTFEEAVAREGPGEVQIEHISAEDFVGRDKGRQDADD